MFSGYLALTRSFDRAFYYRVLWFSFPLGRACVQQLVQRAVADSEEEKERARESKREREFVEVGQASESKGIARALWNHPGGLASRKFITINRTRSDEHLAFCFPARIACTKFCTTCLPRSRLPCTAAAMGISLHGDGRWKTQWSNCNPCCVRWKALLRIDSLTFCRQYLVCWLIFGWCIVLRFWKVYNGSLRFGRFIELRKLQMGNERVMKCYCLY